MVKREKGFHLPQCMIYWIKRSLPAAKRPFLGLHCIVFREKFLRVFFNKKSILFCIAHWLILCSEEFFIQQPEEFFPNY